MYKDQYKYRNTVPKEEEEEEDEEEEEEEEASRTTRTCVDVHPAAIVQCKEI